MIENLYYLLIDNPNTTFNKLSVALQSNADDIKKHLLLLKHMDLDVCFNDDNVTLRNPADRIDEKLITSQLIQAKITTPLKFHLSTTSTNELARNSKFDGIYICDHQSQGKGRQARQWLTPLGQSIAISLAYGFNFGLGQLSGLNIAIGVAIIKTAKFYNCNDLGLKWPNDVLGKQGKIAGILIEATGNNLNCRVIIGIGINWNIRKELLDSINQPCENININHVTRSQFIARLIIEVNNVLLDFSDNKLSNVLNYWQQHDFFKGQNINVIQSDEITQAKYLGVDQQGCLLVKSSGDIKTLASGEVSIRKEYIPIP